MRFIARYLSQIFCFLIYMLDVYFAYLAGGWEFAVISLFGIIAVMEILFGLALVFLKAHSLKKSRASDAALLEQCMNEIMVQSGKKRKIKLYISDDNSLNVYTVGYSIVVSRGLLSSRDTTMIKALLSHNVSHVLYSNCIFSTLLQINLLSVVIFFAASFFEASFIFAGMIFIVLCCVSSFWNGYVFGGNVKKILCRISSFLVKLLFSISRIICCLLTMPQEFEGDAFAVSLGYSYALKDFLEYTGNISHKQNFAEFILGITHPSNERRIVRIEKIEQKYAYSRSNGNSSTQNLFT